MSVSASRNQKAGAWTKSHGSGGVVVWALPLRLFHWLLAGAVVVAGVTGFLGPEWWLGIHRVAGYVIGFLIIFRIVWGFAGSRYARFESFIFSVHTTLDHLAGLVRGHPSHYRGHNPAGALMVFALLGVLASLTISGLIVLGGQENIGILAGLVGFKTGAGAVAIHKIFAIFLLLLVAAHLGGVLAESLLSRENLVRAMISGRKNTKNTGPDVPALSRPGTSILVRAGVISAMLLIAGVGIARPLLAPGASGYVIMAPNPVYASECGDCHMAYHPSLLPASSWIKLMAGLDDHFGEDASLDAVTVRNITDFLTRYSSEHWDSEAANNLRVVSARDPLRITGAPYWQRRHKEIAPAVFKQKNIGSKANCAACHSDAASGHFDDEKIAIPKPVRAVSADGNKSKT